MCQTINYVFEYKEDVDLQNADVILMEECYSNDGLIKNEDIELFKQVIDIDKNLIQLLSYILDQRQIDLKIHLMLLSHRGYHGKFIFLTVR